MPTCLPLLRGSHVSRRFRFKNFLNNRFLNKFIKKDKILDILITTILILYRKLYRNIVSIIVLNIGTRQYNIKINLAISCSPNFIESFVGVSLFKMHDYAIEFIKYRKFLFIYRQSTFKLSSYEHYRYKTTVTKQYALIDTNRKIKKSQCEFEQANAETHLPIRQHTYQRQKTLYCCRRIHLASPVAFYRHKVPTNPLLSAAIK